MDPGLVLVENFGWLVAVLGLNIAAPLFAWSGYLYMSSMGDPNRSASARNSIIGVCVGVIVIGCAFIAPRVISEFVVEPAGGVVFEDRTGINCDGMLRDQLVINREASDARRVNVVVRRIQSRFEDCGEVLWTPVAVDSVRDMVSALYGVCFDTSGWDSVSGVEVPRGLIRIDTRGGDRLVSGRDARNNIIVHWRVPSSGVAGGLPSDGAVCWLYVSSIETWVEGYR